MRPETLEAALAWLESVAGTISFGGGDVWVSAFNRDVDADAEIVNGDIPAAIVEAVQEVWDQVNGKGGHDRT